MPKRTAAIVGGLLLLALALRLHHLDFRALWWDEGLSLFFARLGYSEQARFAVLLADTNPPVYRLLLGVWTTLVGSSVWATRLFSALAGALLVALVYRLAYDFGWFGGAHRRFRMVRLANHQSTLPALLAAALAAISPMLIYYAQEAKGYSLVATSGAAAVLLWQRLQLRAGRKTSARLWLAWGGCVLLALGSHYIFAFLLLFLNLWSLWQLRKLDHRAAIRHLAWLVGVQAAVALALLPYMLVTFGGTAAAVRGETGDFSGLHGPGVFFGQHLVEFALGPTGARGVGLALAALLVITGGVGAYRARIRGTLMASLIVGPLLLGFGLNAYHEFFFPRFLLYTVPLLLVLVAFGLAELTRHWQPAASLGAVLFALAFAPTLSSYYAAPGDPAEDWRPLAAAVQPHMRPDDGAIYVWGWIPGYLYAYLPPSPQPEYTLGYFTPENLAPELTALVERHERIWLFDYQVDTFDQRNAAGRWLGERAALAYAQWLGNAHVSLFVLPVAAANSEPGAMETVRFANGLALTFRPFNVTARPGDAVTVELNWKSTQVLDERLTVFLHVLNAEGVWVAGRDSEPWNGLRPFPDWVGQRSLTDWRAALLPPDLPPGQYTVRVGLYDPVTGERMLLTDGADGVTVGTVRVN